MLRNLAIAAVFLTAAPAMAQTPTPWSNEIDPAAILNFDPDGAAGIPLTVENVRAYLSQRIAPPPSSREYNDSLDARRTAAKAAKAEILSDPNLRTPLWTEQAFELQDGTVRPMTEREKAVFAELDTLDAIDRSTRAQRELSMAVPGERASLANAIARLLRADVRMSKRIAGGQSDGYREVDGDWVWFDYEGDTVVGSHPATPEVENALLRYQLATMSLDNGVLAHKLNPTVFEAVRGPVQ